MPPHRDAATGCCSTTTRSTIARIAAGLHAPRHRGPSPPHVPRVRRARSGAVRAGAAAVRAPAQPRGAGPHGRRTLGELAGLGRRLRTRHAAPGGAATRSPSDAPPMPRAVLLDADDDRRDACARLGARDRGRPSRRRRARRRAQGRADLPRRPRARDPRRRRRGRLHRRSRGTRPTRAGCGSCTTSTTDLGGRDVVLVEDIVDTGLTLAYLVEPARGARTRAAVDVRAARPARPADRPARRCATGASSSPTCSCSATGCTSRDLYRNLPFVVAGDRADVADDARRLRRPSCTAAGGTPAVAAERRWYA